MRSALIATLASLGAVGIRAHPTAHSNTLGRRAVDLESFRMKIKTDYKNATEVLSDPSIPSLTRRTSAEDIATQLVKTTVPGATFRLANDHYVGTNGVAHFYFKQTANGLDIDNADFNVNVGRNGEIFSFGNSFTSADVSALPKLSKRDTVDPADALKSAVGALQLPVSAQNAQATPKTGVQTFAITGTEGTASEPEARLVYIQDTEGKVTLVWRLETDILSNWLLSYVDAKDGSKVHAVVDYSADASYEVYPWGLQNPTEGSRIVIEDPFDSQASEFGWHSTGSDKFTATRGNNAVAQSNWDNVQTESLYLGLPRPSDPNLEFHYPYSLNETDYKKYVNASITQLYYTANVYHDLLHRLGFNEQAGNFEINNNGAGGIGNDFAYLHAQDGSGSNNANFATPPDGRPARMRMYMWTNTEPSRDCSFDAGVVIHEYTHGLSNRLTGGPANSGCLALLESGGMGEGWGDFYATAIRLKPQDTRETDYAMGEWVNGNELGIRAYLYSTDMAVNPHVYTDVNAITRVHGIGTVWATILYEVLWNLIDKHGKNDAGTPEFDANGVPTDGKFLTMKLVLDGMALQPCNPTFISARDAIIDADKALTGGSNACELWKAFAKRGVGQGARYMVSNRENSFVVPEGVC
ncbi:extracellular metallo proteinase MEP [Dothidotthia symphoricarpi CBS 119687]|uniref:Extracellular metalloproteinase n=1 Tax=Dothidotthia symphoricarpi CBS 119687 TaxID=1392245 RepID=A0A6A5ZXE1_9PLEO|nr:extracellular metallo proteinase MEP [Dothidotthia symphoricarpi CBS 119687]KAF2124432.1 extracellular metallo proteinase MEP [Dothidotthia symphoricarpi CBS 119687]